MSTVARVLRGLLLPATAAGCALLMGCVAPTGGADEGARSGSEEGFVGDLKKDPLSEVGSGSGETPGGGEDADPGPGSACPDDNSTDGPEPIPWNPDPSQSAAAPDDGDKSH